MFLVDTSVWIEVFRKPSRLRLETVAKLDEIAICLPVLQEVLQGFRDEAAFRIAREAMVALPIVDTTVAVARRMRAGRPVFSGDRSHVYDQLVDRGITAGRVAAVFAALQAVLTVIGVVTASLGAAWAFASAGFVAAVLIFGATFGGFVSTTKGSTT